MGGFVFFCGGNEGWVGRGMDPRMREDGRGRGFHGGMVAGEGDLRQGDVGSGGEEDGFPPPPPPACAGASFRRGGKLSTRGQREWGSVHLAHFHSAAHHLLATRCRVMGAHRRRSRRLESGTGRILLPGMPRTRNLPFDCWTPSGPPPDRGWAHGTPAASRGRCGRLRC